MSNTNETSKLLSELIAEWVTIPQDLDMPITGLSIDSRTTKPGHLFIACPGTHENGEKYIKSAKMQGAVAALLHTSKNTNTIKFDNNSTDNSFPIIPIQHLNEKVGVIASRFYNNPSDSMEIVAVTGTSGKTSCTHFIANALTMAGQSAAVIGTIGNGLAGHYEASTLTTPDAITLQHYLAQFRDQQAQIVAMEASSHGLAQFRLSGIQFDIGIFTNLTRDHLDYHATMADYASAKRKLFEQPSLRYGIFNLDDPYGKQWFNEFQNKLDVYGYSLNSSEWHKSNNTIIAGKTNIICADMINLQDNGISAAIHTPWGDGVLHTNLLGRFNLSNLLAVLTALGILNIPFADILNYLAQLSGVPGRMQYCGGGKQPLVVVDYSHKPDALAQALQSLREHCTGKLWCVFGCGGNRDKGKRPLMGEIAATYADEIILTNDNPRDEQPQQIIAEIMAGIADPTLAIIEQDRGRAISHAISCARAGDAVLIAGKGHETYQIIGTEKLPFNDMMHAKMCLAASES